MAEIFLTSDTHFSHVGVTQFLNKDGSKLRPWDNIEEMDEALVDNWNSVVGPKSRIYHIGDAVMNRRALPIMARLNGIKILIAGNHDEFRTREYLEYFEDVKASHTLDKSILTHIPVHPMSKSRFVRNIHGHLHSNRVRFENGEIDPWYQCVCVEQTNFKPISFEVLKEKAIKECEAMNNTSNFIYNLSM